jgi:hypothetical protein
MPDRMEVWRSIIEHLDEASGLTSSLGYRQLADQIGESALRARGYRSRIMERDVGAELQSVGLDAVEKAMKK